MIVRFRLGNITETRPVHGKLDHHVSAGRKRDGFKQLHVSVEFTKYGNTLFRPVQKLDRTHIFSMQGVLVAMTVWEISDIAILSLLFKPAISLKLLLILLTELNFNTL